MREQAFLNAGVCIELVDVRGDEPVSETLYYEGGIKSFVEYLNQKKACTPVHNDVIYINGQSGDMTAEVAIQYNDTLSETIVTFANNMSTIVTFANNMSTIEGGTHETGFKTALTKVMNDYGRKVKLLKDGDKNLMGEDVREGICVVMAFIL